MDASACVWGYAAGQSAPALELLLLLLLRFLHGVPTEAACQLRQLRSVQVRTRSLPSCG
jgi:hypothetical protein